jgi:hypothetical protein
MTGDDFDVFDADARIARLGLGHARQVLLVTGPDPADPAYLDHIAPERLALSNSEVEAFTAAFTASVTEFVPMLQQAFDMVAVALNDAVTAVTVAYRRPRDAPESLMIRGKPAGLPRWCYHGNPRGGCRDCSQHRH